MHNNYYFLRQLSASLEERLKDTVVSECFSQNKDELVIRFETRTNSFYIKANLQANFSCISFPDNFHRARKNSVDLFDELIGLRVSSIQQFENERSFAIHFNYDISLLLKMHGNRSNIILFREGEVVNLFKNNLVADSELKLTELNRSIDWSKEAFIKNESNLKALYFTWGKIVFNYLNEIGFKDKSTEEKWNIIQLTKAKLEKPNYFITEINGVPVLSLLPIGLTIKEHQDPIKALTDFYYTLTQTFTFQKEKDSALSFLKSKLESFESYLKKTSDKLNEVEHNTNYKIWADLIMANLHAIPARAELTTVSNFYNNNVPIEIKLKKDFSPQRNAEVYYRKSKNQKIETERLNLAINGKQKEIDVTKEKINAVNTATDLKELRALIGKFEIDTTKEQQKEILPYHAFEHNGFKIWVGRNAQNNDTLTLKYTFKDDLWLHAKDVAGSHVIIKHQAGKTFPKDVIERAAQLAAYNSKRKNESLCPVIVTPKKFVRKRKGDPAGAVVVEREEVILVEPRK